LAGWPRLDQQRDAARPGRVRQGARRRRLGVEPASPEQHGRRHGVPQFGAAPRQQRGGPGGRGRRDPRPARPRHGTDRPHADTAPDAHRLRHDRGADSRPVERLHRRREHEGSRTHLPRARGSRVQHLLKGDTPMAITRRQFLKRSAASAAALSLAPRFRWLPGTSVSYASGPSDAIVVLVRQYGGNDGINTVYPISDPPPSPGSSNQKAKYNEFRPTLALPSTNAGCAARVAQGAPGSSPVLSIGPNSDGSTYAPHPAMSALHNLYVNNNNVAVVNGVHYPYADHSHFRSEQIWYTVDPVGTGGIGWFGAYLKKYPALYPSTAVP